MAMQVTVTKPVFRIRDVLVRIRIRIPDPYHFITVTDQYPKPSLFFSGFQDEKI
jgi:hypothetical protein